ncbi:MAG: hypothetical protein HKN03_08410 [Acidimicrobiales bacterium]|nr:hypothetical protein [Acidimicrobiales bacterium]
MSVLLAEPPAEVTTPEPSRSIRNLCGDVLVMSVLLLAAAFTTTGWFSADEVVMRQQSTALASTGSWVVPGNTAADAIDPDRQFVLLARSDSAGTEIVPYGKHPALPATLSVFERMAGNPGRYLPAVLAALAAALFVSASSGWSRLGFWLVGLSSPLLFHVTVLWGHAHALGFSTLALYGVHRVCRRRAPDAVGAVSLVAGIVGASLMRSEGLLLGAAVGLAFIVIAAVSKANRYLAALSPLPFAAAIGVYLGEPVLREWLIGGSPSPLGPSTGDGLTLASRLSVARIMLIQPSLSGSALGSLRLVGLILLVIASGAALRRAISADRLRLLALLGAAGFVLAFAEGPSPALLVTVPLLVVALPWATFTTAFNQVLGVVTVSFTLAVILTSYDNAGGGDWGARYLFIVVPFLAAMALPAVQRAWLDPRGRSVVVSAAVAAAAMQGGVVLDLMQRDQTVATVDDVAETIRRHTSRQSDWVVAVSDERLARFLYDRGLRGASFFVPLDQEEEFLDLLDLAGADRIIWVDLGSDGDERDVEPSETHGSVSIRTVVRR